MRKIKRRAACARCAGPILKVGNRRYDADGDAVHRRCPEPAAPSIRVVDIVQHREAPALERREGIRDQVSIYAAAMIDFKKGTT